MDLNMHVKVPQVKTCCCCLPLRWGIIVFGCVNIIFSLLAVVCLVITTELRRSTIINDQSLEVVTATVLYGIFGMGVILNILLLIAGCQKDTSMLRLYNYYAVATTMAALVPAFMLITRVDIMELVAAFVAILVQCYVILLVRSEIVKLELNLAIPYENYLHSGLIVDVPDREALVEVCLRY